MVDVTKQVETALAAILDQQKFNRYWVSVLPLALALVVTMTTQLRDKGMSSIRVGLNWTGSAQELDPGNIVLATQYHLISNLYGRLIKYNQSGQLVSDVPKSFELFDRSIRFIFDSRATTVDGHTIDARDAELSLKRLILKGTAGHGDIRKFLCPGYQLKSLEDRCPGVSRDGNSLTLTVEKSEYLPLLIPTLQSADYSIIPASVINPTNGELLDKRHRNTSGPYYVEEDDKEGNLILRANPRHYLYNEQMPLEVKYVALGGSRNGSELFLEGKIDVLPTQHYWTGEAATKILTSSNFNVHETLPIRLLLIMFSESALKKFSVQQRFVSALAVGNAFREKFGMQGGTLTSQFFQALSDGSLTNDELKTISRVRKEASTQTKNPMVYGALPRHFERLQNNFTNDSNVIIKKVEQSPFSLPKTERPDLFVATNDAAWTENISLIGYNIEVGTFTLPNIDLSEWLQNYISISEKDQRIKVLRELHLKMLMNASFVPIEAAPYYAAAHKPWVFNQSKLAAGTDLWMMRKQ
jgi:hypothetical protein